MKSKINSITVRSVPRFTLIASGVILIISSITRVQAEPVRKDAALTHRYLELRTVPPMDNEEESEDTTQTFEEEDSDESVKQNYESSSESTAPALDFFRKYKSPRKTWADPWKVEARLESTPEEEPSLEMVTPYLEAVSYTHLTLPTKRIV